MTTSAWSNERTDAAETATNGATPRASGPNASTDNTVVDGEVVEGELVETSENGADPTEPEAGDIVDAELVEDLIDDDTTVVPSSEATIPAPPIYPSSAGPVDSGSVPVVPGPMNALVDDADADADVADPPPSVPSVTIAAPTAAAFDSTVDASVDEAADAAADSADIADDLAAAARSPRPNRDPDRLRPPSASGRPQRLAAPESGPGDSQGFDSADTDDVSVDADTELVEAPSHDVSVDAEISHDAEIGDEIEPAATPTIAAEHAADHDLDDDHDDLDDDAPVARPMLQLRQIAGLTAGTIMDLQERSYDFADRDDSVGFSVLIDDYDRAVIVPGSAEARIDGEPIDEPTVLGSAVLDVGTARFTIQPVKERPKASDWVDANAFTEGDDNPLIEVPTDLDAAPPEKSGKRRGLLRRKGKDDAQAQVNDVVTWEFTEAVRQTRIEIATRKRFSHPDPAELAIRAECAAPILGTRPPGHPEFAQFAAMSADVPWLPNFSDINAIPTELGYQIQPLLALPSVPVVVDLTNGPLGIVGTPSAAEACARQVVLALRAMSTDELQIHIAPEWDGLESWVWADELVNRGPVELPEEDDGTYPVVVLDTSCHYGNGFTHEDAIAGDLGVVILAPEVENLPPYCATVLQIDPTGRALLTNQHGQVIRGTPIGIPVSAARDIAQDLIDLADQRRP